MKLNPIVQTASRGFVLAGIATMLVSVSGVRSLSTATRPAQLVATHPKSQINLRKTPSASAPRLGYGLPGDRVEIVRDRKGDDGLTWFYVRFQRSGAVGWIRSDFVQVSASDSNPSPPVASLPQPKDDAPRPPITAADLVFTSDQIKYFMEVAIGSEYGGESTPKVRKWQGDVRIQALGKPTSADLSTIRGVINEVNALVNGEIRLQLVDRNPNIRINFAPESQFSKIEPAYVPINYGFFTTNWNAQGVINRANILITTNNVTQKERSHLIREELTQSLGLMRDSSSYSDSIFYQPWTDVTQYSAMDRALIQMLYNPNLRSGMTKAQASSVLNSLRAQKPLDF
jgi:hypothetical protein